MEQHILLSSPRYHTDLVELKLIGNSEEVEVSKDTCLKKNIVKFNWNFKWRVDRAVV